MTPTGRFLLAFDKRYAGRRKDRPAGVAGCGGSVGPSPVGRTGDDAGGSRNEAASRGQRLSVPCMCSPREGVCSASNSALPARDVREVRTRRGGALRAVHGFRAGRLGVPRCDRAVGPQGSTCTAGRRAGHSVPIFWGLPRCKAAWLSPLGADAGPVDGVQQSARGLGGQSITGSPHHGRQRGVPVRMGAICPPLGTAGGGNHKSQVSTLFRGLPRDAV